MLETKEEQKHFMDSIDGFLIFFDISKFETLSGTVELIEKILLSKEMERFPMVLIGTKCDLERNVPFEEGMKIANKYNIPFFETSSKECINVEDSVFSLVDEIYKQGKFKPQKEKKECLVM
jgi:GTPase KRas